MMIADDTREVVGAEQLTSWGRSAVTATAAEVDPLTDDVYEAAASAPFAPDDAINQKLVLTRANLWALELDAIVVGNNEALSDRSGATGECFRRAGPELELEVQRLEGCRTGESRLTASYTLPASHIIHTVGPRYQLRYAGAAECALHWCYRSALHLCREHALRTVALCQIHTDRRGYPHEEGAHVALRTVRRFLERWPQALDLVVLVLPGPTEERVYARLAPLYFPRSRAEAAAAACTLPTELGDADGEMHLPERRMRVGSSPGAPPALGAPEHEGAGASARASGREEEDRGGASADLHASFCAVVASPDERQRRKSGGGGVGGVVEQDPKQRAAAAGAGEEQDVAVRMYGRMLRRARNTPPTDTLAAARPLYVCGKDRMGRPALIIVGRAVHACCGTQAEREQMILYIVRETAELVLAPFVVVFLASGMPEDAGPTFDFLRLLLEAMPSALRARLEAFHLVHPSLKMRFAFVLLGVLLWGKLQWVDRLPQLHRHFVPGQLHVPEFVVHLDDVDDRPRALPAAQRRAPAARAPTSRPPALRAPAHATQAARPASTVYSPLHHESVHRR